MSVTFWILIWLTVGFCGGLVVLVANFLKNNEIRVKDIHELVLLTFLGPIGCFLVIDGILNHYKYRVLYRRKGK